MNDEYKEYLKNNCFLKQLIDGEYTFNGECIYGLMLINIPADCTKIEMADTIFNNRHNIDKNKVFTKKEQKELFKYMKSIGFTYSEAAGLNNMPVYIGDDLHEELIKIYTYFIKRQ